MRTAPPRPDEAPPTRRSERRWTPALGVLAVIVLVTGGADLVGGAIRERAEPIEVGESLTVTPEPGWEVVSGLEEPEVSRVLLRGGRTDLLVIALSGGNVSALEVARDYAAVLDARFAQVSIGEPAVDGIERVRFGYVGVSGDGLAIEGVVAVVSGASGNAAVFDGFAPKGSLGAAIGDLREMVDSAEVV